MDHDRILQLTEAYKACLRRLITHVEAGMSLSVTWEIAYRDFDNEYRKICLLENVQPVNHMLDAPTVEMFARFGLDALFGAKGGACDNGDQRAAFWQVFRRVTRPTQQAVLPVVDAKTAAAGEHAAP